MTITAIALLLLALLAVARGQQEVGRSRRKNFEVMVPMSDGVELHTKIYFPRDSTSKTNDGKFPCVLDRSPYGYGDMEEFMNIFLPFG